MACLDTVKATFQNGTCGCCCCAELFFFGGVDLFEREVESEQICCHCQLKVQSKKRGGSSDQSVLPGAMPESRGPSRHRATGMFGTTTLQELWAVFG